MNKARVWKTASGEVFVRQTEPETGAQCLGDHVGTAVQYDHRGKVVGIMIEYYDGSTVPNAKLQMYHDLKQGVAGTAILRWGAP